MGSSHTLDQLDICLDDTHAIANAGRPADRPGRAAGRGAPGRKLLTLVHSMLAGGDCIDVTDALLGAVAGAR
jgi:hypothetical protein